MMIFNIVFISFMMVVFLFSIHFAALPISKQIYENSPSSILINSNHLLVEATPHPDLYLSFLHFSDDGLDNDFARAIHLSIGGLSIYFKYGHHYSTRSSLYTYGFVSRDSELFWKDIAIGKTFYNNPFAYGKHLDTSVYDKSSNRFCLTSVFDSAEHYPMILHLHDITYNNKSGESQSIPELMFYIKRRRWTSPFFYYTGLSSFFNHTIDELGFVAPTPIGIDNDVCCGPAFRISEHPFLDHLFKRVLNHPHLILTLEKEIQYEVESWLHNSKEY